MTWLYVTGKKGVSCDKFQYCYLYIILKHKFAEKQLTWTVHGADYLKKMDKEGDFQLKLSAKNFATNKFIFKEEFISLPTPELNIQASTCFQMTMMSTFFVILLCKTVENGPKDVSRKSS